MIGKKKSVLGDTECKTTDNLSKKCIFPFEYAGKIYNECIPRRGKYYCAIETKPKRRWPFISKKPIDPTPSMKTWGTCGKSCPGVPGTQCK